MLYLSFFYLKKMDQNFADQSKKILFLIFVSLVCVLIFMTFDNMFALAGRAFTLVLLAYIGNSVWTQIQTVKAELLANATTPSLTADEMSALNTNLGVSYLFLLIVVVNFIFITRSLFMASNRTATSTNDTSPIIHTTL